MKNRPTKEFFSTEDKFLLEALFKTLKKSAQNENFKQDLREKSSLFYQIFPQFLEYIRNPSKKLASLKTAVRNFFSQGGSLKEVKEALWFIWQETEKEFSRKELQALTRIFFLFALEFSEIYAEVQEKAFKEYLRELKRLNRIYSLLREINLLIFEEREEIKPLFQRACEILVREGDFTLAWVIIKEGKKDSLVAIFGKSEIEKEFLSFKDTYSFFLPQESIILGNLKRQSPKEPWIERLKNLGLSSLAVFPLEIEEKGSLCLASQKASFFTPSEIKLLEEIARDLSLGYIYIQKSRRLEEALFWDELTGLPNRRYFLASLEHEISVAQKMGLNLALITLDIDRFSLFNQTEGHLAGDQVLKEVASRLSQLIPSAKGTVARIDPDSFAFSYLLEPGERNFSWLKNFQKVLSSFIRVNKHPFKISFSYGLSLFPQDARSPKDLLATSELALRKAQHTGPGSTIFYSPHLTQKTQERFSLLAELEKALERGEFCLYFQPRINISLSQITGFEALLRWEHPQKGILSPGLFIPLLEESGLIVEVGHWVIKETLAFLRRFPYSLKGSFNLSVRQFKEGSFLGVLNKALSENQLDPQKVEIEITESLLLEAGPEAEEIFQEIESLGVSVALDDFGTGYSSFAYLKRIPARVLKIDYSFVKELPQSREDSQVVMAIVSLSRSLGKSVVAEGVERKEQLAFLQGLGVEEIQGYLYSPPLPEKDFLAFVEQFPNLHF